MQAYSAHLLLRRRRIGAVRRIRILSGTVPHALWAAVSSASGFPPTGTRAVVSRISGSASATWTATVTLWLALASTCSAHPPYVAPRLHAANLALSTGLGLTAGLLTRRRSGVPAAVAIGLLVFLSCSFGGWLLCIVLSM